MRMRSLRLCVVLGFALAAGAAQAQYSQDSVWTPQSYNFSGAGAPGFAPGAAAPSTPSPPVAIPPAYDGRWAYVHDGGRHYAPWAMVGGSGWFTYNLTCVDGSNCDPAKRAGLTDICRVNYMFQAFDLMACGPGATIYAWAWPNGYSS